MVVGFTGPKLGLGQAPVPWRDGLGKAGVMDGDLAY